MKQSRLPILSLALLLAVLTVSAHAGFIDALTKGLGLSDAPATSLDDATIIKGLKEALETGTTRAVKSVSQSDGYFNNHLIKIIMPERIQTASELLGKFGFQQQVDDFVLSMNRAAEKAAPLATTYFVSALKELSFDDARKILQGDATSATEYFKRKTSAKIYGAFKPVVTSNMKEVGVARRYKQLLDKVDTIPFVDGIDSLDLDHYVTTKAVDGLFIMLGEEEKKIRTDPAARGSELLKKVFGR